MMKKYLMMGASALVMGAMFTACSNDDGISADEYFQAKYNLAFEKAFGKVSPNQDWGFGPSGSTRATRANSGQDYPQTSTGINANANEWANNIKNDNTGFGGWVVPPALTDDQKKVVIAYFQSHPGLDYVDPHYRHFFVQQVYKGGTAQAGESSENITAASNTVYNSDNMNLLTVGENHQHINNFNAGTCSEREDVLDNGSDILAGKTSYHTDQIMLMVNIDDTSCFGYHETGSSTHHDNKAGLVGWETIDTWAKTNYPGYAGWLNDTWNRSFMGFDLALKEGAQAYATDEAGKVQYADFSQAPGQPKYAWDGENIFPIVETTEKSDEWGNKWLEYGDFLPEYKAYVGYLTTNENFYVATNSKVTLNQSYSFGGNDISTKSYENDFKDYVVLDEVKVEGASNNKAKVLNLKRINELIEDGYLPVLNKSLQDWVQVGTSDGYFTDWIVTLTEAKRQTTTVVPDSNYRGIRIMAEDLSASEASDFDFNDVVFDVEWTFAANETSTNKVKVTLWAAGGTLPLKINSVGGAGGFEVHNALGVSEIRTMINTHAENRAGTFKDPKTQEMITYYWLDDAKDGNPYEETITLANNASISKDSFEEDVNTNLRVEVQKDGSWYLLTANQGTPACKIACPVGTSWALERHNMTTAFSQFKNWVNNSTPTNWYTTKVADHIYNEGIDVICHRQHQH